MFGNWSIKKILENNLLRVRKKKKKNQVIGLVEIPQINHVTIGEIIYVYF